jgi:release factor glutamine methyltransferase
MAVTRMTGLGGTTTSDEWTVRRIIEWTTAHLKKHGSDTPRLDTEILLAQARGCRRIELYTRFDDVLSEKERTTMRDLVRRRAQSEPVAYLVGHREFFGLDFRVTPAVLIPRPDTETLVVELLDVAKSLPAPRILDVGTGSGCIAIAAAVNQAAAQVTATDSSEAALSIARENAESHHVLERVRFLSGDLFGSVGSDRFDIVASNPPYIADHEKETLQNDVRKYEPHSALFAGPTGLELIFRLIDEAPSHLVPGGTLMIEISPEQASTVVERMESKGCYSGIRVIKDLPGQARVVRANLQG